MRIAALALASIITLLPAHAGGAADQAKPLKVFILAGQSNMVGQGKPEELPEAYRTPPKNVLVMARNGRLGPLQPVRRFGPEVSFAHELSKAWPDETIVLIKHAVGGTSALAWSPTWTAEGAAITENERNGPLYKQLMDIVAKLPQHGEYQIMAMLWAQGGRDGRYEPAARAYEQNLTKIIEAARRDLKQPDLPFVFAHTVDAPQERFPYIHLVRAAQVKVAQNVPHTKLVPIEGLARNRDNTHFNTEGQLELGRRFARAFLDLLSKDQRSRAAAVGLASYAAAD